MSAPRRQGSEAEDRAADFLLAQGYTIVTRRFKAKSGEIDLVALDGETLVFVEVKQRGEGYRPEDSIGKKKISHLVAAAKEYVLVTEEQARAVRYDVVAIDPLGLRHHVDAFQP